MQKKISIGVAVYNGQQTLARAIESLINQTYTNLEIIIIDDFSLDNSREIIKQYADRDSRIKFKINKTNKGLIYNFNELFETSSGEYFMWSDQDDVRENTFIDKAQKILENNPKSVLCHSETKVFFENIKNILHINSMSKISKKNNIVSRYKKLLWYYNDTNIYGLIRSSALKKTSLWNKMNGSSNNLLFQLILIGKFEYIDEPLFLYSGKEITERPSIRDEYKILTKYKSPFFYYAGLILLKNQFMSILKSKINIFNKFKIVYFLFEHFLLTNFSKFLFRIFYKKKDNSINNIILKICIFMFPINSEVKIIVDECKYPKYFPKFSQYRKFK